MTDIWVVDGGNGESICQKNLLYSVKNLKNVNVKNILYNVKNLKNVNVKNLL